MSAALSYRKAETAFRKRTVIEEHIQRLVDLLDDLDGDPDAEAVNEDGDPLDTGELDTADDEPWLGSVGSSLHPEDVPQLMWASGGTDDREKDAGDEGEPDQDEEAWQQAPRLG